MYGLAEQTNQRHILHKNNVAFITGASRGIGALSAIELAKAGFDVAITARTLHAGEAHDHGSYGEDKTPLAGCLEEVAEQVRALGREALCLRSDILDPKSVQNAYDTAVSHFGRIDLLFNNACYQAKGNMDYVANIDAEDLKKIYQANVLTPLLLVQAVLPSMQMNKRGCIINMVSGSAMMDPPVAPDAGGWGFGYASSKAALIRMAGCLRAENSGESIQIFNIEPGFVITEVMRANGLSDDIAKNFNPTRPETIAAVVRWLATDPGAHSLQKHTVIHAPQLVKKLNF